MAAALDKLVDPFQETLNANKNDDLRFDFCDFFDGHTKVSGWFADTFGNPRRHFCGNFFGCYKDGVFQLDEKLFYTDGMKESRVWSISISDDGEFRATSDSLIGEAIGSCVGNTLKMRYAMNVQIDDKRVWRLAMKDQMILQRDGSLHNITGVYKWGVKIGAVSAQYQRHRGEKLCCIDT